MLFIGSDDQNVYAFGLSGADVPKEGIADRPTFSTLHPELKF